MIFDPNPLFFEMVRIFKENYTPDNKVIICNEGSSRCFSSKTKVITSIGPTQITELKESDLVQTFNEQTQSIEFKPILEVLSMENKKPCYKITLKNGNTIEATEDHEFYFEGAWHSLKYIISLWNERQNINKR